MLDRQRFHRAVNDDAESGVRRDAHRCALDTIRIMRDGHPKPFWSVADSVGGRRRRPKMGRKELNAWLARYANSVFSR